MLEERKNPHSFADSVREARKYAKLSRSELQTRADLKEYKLSESYIEKIELGKKEKIKQTTKETIARQISDLCGVRYEWLLDPFDPCMTQAEEDKRLRRYAEQKALEDAFREGNEQAQIISKKGYQYFLWLVLQQIRSGREDYEINLKGETAFEVSDGEGHQVTFDGEGIKEDLLDYAEFKVKKTIERLIKEQSIREFVKAAEKDGITVLEGEK